MKTADLLIAANTVWVVVAAILVMFMQAGFAFLEAGLTRMKNAAHIAGKNVLIFGICSLVYWAVGFGLAFGDGNAIVGTSGFFPSSDALLGIAAAPFSFFGSIPAGAGYLFEVVFAGVSLAIVWGAMAERAKLWVYFAFGVVFTVIYSVISHWIWHAGGWLYGLGMQDFAGSTVVHYQGALAALAGALLLGPRIGKFGTDGRANPIPGHNVPFAVLGTLILWFGWFGFNPGSTLGVVTGDRIGYFGYVALTTNLAAAAGALGGIAHRVGRAPEAGHLDDAERRHRRARRHHGRLGFVAPWAAVVIGLVAAAMPGPVDPVRRNQSGGRVDGRSPGARRWRPPPACPWLDRGPAGFSPPRRSRRSCARTRSGAEASPGAKRGSRSAWRFPIRLPPPPDPWRAAARPGSPSRPLCAAQGRCGGPAGRPCGG